MIRGSRRFLQGVRLSGDAIDTPVLDSHAAWRSGLWVRFGGRHSPLNTDRDGADGSRGMFTAVPAAPLMILQPRIGFVLGFLYLLILIIVSYSVPSVFLSFGDKFVPGSPALIEIPTITDIQSVS